MRHISLKSLAAIMAVGVLCLTSRPAGADEGTGGGQWRHNGGDSGSSKYSALSQINAGNVEQLGIAWRWASPDPEITDKVRSRQFKATPLMVDGVMYVSTGLNVIVAIDPGTGEEIWRYDPKAYDLPTPTHGGLSSRGVEYWTDGTDARIVLATGALQLVAVNAKTGELYPDFGEDGIVDLSKGLGREFARKDYGINSPPIICRDTIVIGCQINDFGMTKEMPPGHVRGYDVRTGEMKWRFNTIPQLGEFGVETWEDGSWQYSGNTNVWTLMSADEELGYVYLPTGTPTNDHYGGHRPGDNLFAESLICVNAETGERVWHFQGVHHGVWDYDFPAAPNLIDVTVGGKKIKAVAQVSKQGFTYVLDRVTGEPVWPIEERPVIQSVVPGEKTAATQPFPTKPPPFEPQGISIDDLIDFTPELRAEAEKIVEDFVLGPLFTPPIVAGEGGKKAMIQVPGMAGGANWGGAAADLETGIIYVPSQRRPGTMGVVAPDPSRSNMRYNRGRTGARGPQGLPLLKPPYATVTAIDLNEGEHVWRVPHGQGPTDHEAIKHLNLGPLGASAHAGLSAGWPMVTKSLLFVAQAQRKPGGGRRSPGIGYIRAFDKKTGDVLFETQIDPTPTGGLMTYMHEGKQYVALAVVGAERGHEILAFALP